MNRKYWVLTIFVAVVTTFLFTKFIDNPILVSAEIIDPAPSVDPTPTLVSTSTPVPTPTKVPTPIPTPIPVPQYSSEQIYHLIDDFSGQYGLDPNVLRHVAVCESGFNPASHTKVYAGLFQFDTQTWKTYRTKLNLDPNPNLRFDASEAAHTAAYMLSLHLTHLWPTCYPK